MRRRQPPRCSGNLPDGSKCGPCRLQALDLPPREHEDAGVLRVQDIATFGVELPPGLAATIQRALAKQPSERFPTMDAMLAALETLIAGGIVPAPETTAKPLGSAAPRWSPGRLVTGAVIVSMIGLVAIYGGRRAGWLGNRADPATRSEAAALPVTPFDAYKQGQALLARYDREGYIDQSIDNFRRAVDLKPDYPAAFAGLAMAYWRKYREQRDPMWIKFAGENARRAVQPCLGLGSENGTYVAS